MDGTSVATPSTTDSEADTLLAVDVGNTSTNLGVFAGDELLGTFEYTTPERITTDEARLQVRHALDLMGLKTPAGAILSCVAPNLADAWEQALRHGCISRTYVVGPGLKTGLRMRYDDPGEVGSDRVADVVAAKAAYGSPSIVVDLGTTTNFEVIDADGSFAGGIIAPGVALGANSLSRAAARLPVIELRAPRTVIGKNTKVAMQSGVVLGEAARIDGLLDAVLAELGREAPIVLTGNLAESMAALLAHKVTVDTTLTLRGLQRLWGLNQK